MKGPDKDAAMERFQRGETKVLVATTVIEVGVDVPEATIMVIEHAERFGLAQLHQLRGRVGRGAGRSTCLLLYKGPLGEAARARLEILRETEDGFRIAEEDLRLRGEGDVLGARQAGAPGFRLARLEVHGALLRLARAQAEAAVADGERLAGEENRGLRTAALSVRARRGGEAAGGGVKAARERANMRVEVCSIRRRSMKLKTPRSCAIYSAAASRHIRAEHLRHSGALLHAGILDIALDRARGQDRALHAVGLHHLVPAGHRRAGLCRRRTSSRMVRLLARPGSARQQIASAINPTGRYRQLQDELEVVDTIANRSALAQECLALGKCDEALGAIRRDPRQAARRGARLHARQGARRNTA